MLMLDAGISGIRGEEKLGGELWFYYVPYEDDIDAALHKLREREFRAGRYNPAVAFPFRMEGSARGPQHESVEEAREAAGANGTRSILDMERVSEEPDYCAVSPISKDKMLEVFATVKPNKRMLQDNCELYGHLERGKGVYVIYYDDCGQPDGIFFGGYSFD